MVRRASDLLSCWVGATEQNIARAFEEAVVETLMIKWKRALKETGRKQLVVAGGVSANLQ